MPFNGSGTFSRLYSWVVDAANSVNISSSRMDAELNGFAAALTNCVTRDGQSPPSADLPMGGKKLTNLGAAAAGTDALNRDTADARYVASGSATGTGAVVLANSPALTGVPTAPTAAPGTNTTQLATMAAIQAAIAALINAAPGALDTLKELADALGDDPNYATTITGLLAAKAPLASPPLTGVPTAPTAAAGTATTQLATTAFADALRDVPSNAKAANYPLALTDRGQGVDFNGTSLTCTIPANASVAFPIGSVIVITNLNATSLSIAITTDTLTLSGTTTTGTRTLGQNGEARLRKVGATSWLIAGTALS